VGLSGKQRKVPGNREQGGKKRAYQLKKYCLKMSEQKHSEGTGETWGIDRKSRTARGRGRRYQWARTTVKGGGENNGWTNARGGRGRTIACAERGTLPT